MATRREPSAGDQGRAGAGAAGRAERGPLRADPAARRFSPRHGIRPGRGLGRRARERPAGGPDGPAGHGRRRGLQRLGRESLGGERGQCLWPGLARDAGLEPAGASVPGQRAPSRPAGRVPGDATAALGRGDHLLLRAAREQPAAAGPSRRAPGAGRSGASRPRPLRLELSRLRVGPACGCGPGGSGAAGRGESPAAVSRRAEASGGRADPCAPAESGGGLPARRDLLGAGRASRADRRRPGRPAGFSARAGRHGPGERRRGVARPGRAGHRSRRAASGRGTARGSPDQPASARAGGHSQGDASLAVDEPVPPRHRPAGPSARGGARRAPAQGGGSPRAGRSGGGVPGRTAGLCLGVAPTGRPCDGRCRRGRRRRQGPRDPPPGRGGQAHDGPRDGPDGSPAPPSPRRPGGTLPPPSTPAHDSPRRRGPASGR